jgi:alkylated DNA repair protein (DNA oxidative demethylase)
LVWFSPAASPPPAPPSKAPPPPPPKPAAPFRLRRFDDDDKGVADDSCFDFRRGECARGAACRFSHGDVAAPRHAPAAEVIAPGLVVVRNFLSAKRQRELVDRLVGLDPDFAPPAFATATGTRSLKYQLAQLGRVRWDHVAGAYEASGGDAVPGDLAAVASAAHAAASKADDALPPFDAPDVCLVNFYERGGRLDLHRDDAEAEAAIARGSPVVSLSLGCEAAFATAETRDGQRSRILLRSGDALVFGGPSRRLLHGVERVGAPKTAPWGLGLRPGRLNLTFRAVT